MHPEISDYKLEDIGTIISTRETLTKVLIKDGDTVVIGGLIKDKDQETVYKVPILGDIPILGILFRRKRIFKNRTELLVFITPTIIEQQ